MNASGFTLMEMVIVILIIGIMSAVAVPRYEQRIQLEELNAEKKLHMWCGSYWKHMLQSKKN